MPQQPTLEPPLYHYTDINGLIGILGSKCLRASDARFLNDAQELTFGGDLANELLQEKIVALRADPSGRAGDWNNLEIAAMLEACIHQLESFTVNSTPFVACLSDAHNRLSQWRGYGDQGYAIGFDRATLNKYVTSTPTVSSVRRPRLAKVEYGRENHTIAAAVEQALVDAIDHGPSGHPGSSSYFRVERLIADALPLAKDPAFFEEQEWRISIPEPADRKFRPSALGPIPYTEVKFGDDAVREIVIGPGRDQDVRRAAVTTFISHQFDDPWNVKIYDSGIPFRN
ncbi:DUF2971 domain-containing protein [Rhodococcus ruber]|uniref:DUF2971 domain-containing protein n=1 Tax=Rhodococcus ruber TaxID=1830 RepID=UPI000F540564|nr:DUF2971 domain-containing protein [Rhodococcus ruber]